MTKSSHPSSCESCGSASRLQRVHSPPSPLCHSALACVIISATQALSSSAAGARPSTPSATMQSQRASARDTSPCLRFAGRFLCRAKPVPPRATTWALGGGPSVACWCSALLRRACCHNAPALFSTASALTRALLQVVLLPVRSQFQFVTRVISLLAAPGAVPGWGRWFRAPDARTRGLCTLTVRLRLQQRRQGWR